MFAPRQARTLIANSPWVAPAALAVARGNLTAE